MADDDVPSTVFKGFGLSCAHSLFHLRFQAAHRSSAAPGRAPVIDRRAPVIDRRGKHRHSWRPSVLRLTIDDRRMPCRGPARGRAPSVWLLTLVAMLGACTAPRVLAACSQVPSFGTATSTIGTDYDSGDGEQGGAGRCSQVLCHRHPAAALPACLVPPAWFALRQSESIHNPNPTHSMVPCYYPPGLFHPTLANVLPVSGASWHSGAGFSAVPLLYQHPLGSMWKRVSLTHRPFKTTRIFPPDCLQLTGQCLTSGTGASANLANWKVQLVQCGVQPCQNGVNLPSGYQAAFPTCVNVTGGPSCTLPSGATLARRSMMREQCGWLLWRTLSPQIPPHWRMLTPTHLDRPACPCHRRQRHLHGRQSIHQLLLFCGGARLHVDLPPGCLSVGHAACCATRGRQR